MQEMLALSLCVHASSISYVENLYMSCLAKEVWTSHSLEQKTHFSWLSEHKCIKYLLPIFIVFGTPTLLEFEYITYHSKNRFLNLWNLITFMKYQSHKL